MRRMNKTIIRGRYLIPTVDELLQGMNGSAIFSQLDLMWEYHQLELTPESKVITNKNMKQDKTRLMKRMRRYTPYMNTFSNTSGFLS